MMAVGEQQGREKWTGGGDEAEGGTVVAVHPSRERRGLHRSPRGMSQNWAARMRRTGKGS